jgi:hypothetical protein
VVRTPARPSTSAPWSGPRGTQALYALTTSARNVRFYQGALVAIGVTEALRRRLEELRPKLAPETIPTLAGTLAGALRTLRSSR